MKIPKLSPVTIGLLQSTALAVYTMIVGWVLLNGNSWFGPKPSVLGPTLFLMLLCFSAIYCGAVMVAYPLYIFWEQKNTRLAYKIVFFSALWLLFFIGVTVFLITSVR